MFNIRSYMTTNRLKIILAEKRQTARWVAFQLGKNENTVSRWRSNKVQPSLPQLGEIAEILKVDIHSLISNESSIPCEK